MHAVILEISPSKIAINFWSAILKRSTKPLTKSGSLQTGPDYHVIVFEKLRFHPSTRKHENGVFENLRFRMPKTPFKYGRNARTEQKTSVLKNIRIRVDGAGVNFNICPLKMDALSESLGF